MIITNKMNLPQPFVDAATSDHRYTDRRYSVTAILNGVRQSVLERRHADEIEQDVADRVWMIFGTAVHSILERSQETEDQLKENKLVIDLPNGYQLSGIFDLYDDATGTVTDYKTCAVWKILKGEFEDWRKQTLIYCWMLRQIGFDAKRGEIVALIKDHSKSKAKVGKHPPLPVFRIGWDYTDEAAAEIEAFIMERFREIERCEKLPDAELPLCTEEERWTRDEKYAVMKEGVQRAKKLFDDGREAAAFADHLNATEKGTFYVEHRPGVDAKCEDYCSACEFCTHWQTTYGKEASE